MRLFSKHTVLSAFIFTLPIAMMGQDLTPRDEAMQQMERLREVIRKAEKKGVNTLKEKTALRTAEIFMQYADWDEANKATVEGYHKITGAFRKKAKEYAEMLPDFQRRDIVLMMNTSIASLNDVLSKKTYRLETPYVDWTNLKVEGDQITYQDHPVFLADWTWKPRTKQFTDYHGDQALYMISPTQLAPNGKLNPKIAAEIDAKQEKNAGFVFLSHAQMPSWAKKQDPTITDGPGMKYVMYDIHNPKSLEIYTDLIEQTVPMMAGKQYTQLGYMLCNEPHWNTIEGTWAAAPLSDQAIQAFREWLQAKHLNVANMNARWGTKFQDFKTMELPKIMTESLRGTAMYFDFMSFNMDRVNNWFEFLHKEVLQADPAAKTHIKIMPNLWTRDVRDHGVDMEHLTRMTEIIGNDASTGGPWLSGDEQHWEKYYAFDWVEMAMGYDFYKSISPEKIVYNTEGHFLSTGRYRELKQTPEYVRANYWLATIHGQTATQTWFWARDEKGAYSRQGKVSTGYAASNNYQPRVVNEVHATMADLNSVSEIIMDFQRERKPLRIYYTKASSIHKPDHMMDVFNLYEQLYFEGMPIGFATEGILKHNDHKDWDAILIHETPRVFASELVALQHYLDAGGTVIVDQVSLKADEYGQAFSTNLKSSKGKLIRVKDLVSLKSQAMNFAQEQALLPQLLVSETNELGQKGCSWRVLPAKEKGQYYLNLVNVGKSTATLQLTSTNAKQIKKMTSVLDGRPYTLKDLVLQPNHMLFLKVCL